MANWETKTVKEIVQSIEDDQIVLPVIQRNLVWEKEKIELLFDSLLKENSFGGIMALGDERGNQPLFAFRRFSREGELHESKQQERLDRSILLIIDGQQRLQSFYMGLKGSFGGKDLYFNLLSKLDYDFQFANQKSELPQTKASQEESSKLWYPVRTLYISLMNTGDGFQVADELITHLQVIDENDKNTIQKNTLLFWKSIFEQKTIGVSLVKVNKSKIEDERRRMVELFRRLNDGGTRLSALDLAASTLKGFDYRLEGFLRTDIAEFGDMGFHQDEVIKLLFLLRNNYQKEVTDIDRDDAEFAVANTERILKTLRVLRNLLEYAKLDDYYSDGGKSVIPLYTIAYHIFHKAGNLDGLYDNHDTNNPDFTNIQTWLYLSILNGVFSRGCGWTPYRTGIRRILEIIKDYKDGLFPTEKLFKLYQGYPLTDFSRDISAEHLLRWDRNVVFYLIYGCKSMSGRDIDHIQPRSLLERRGVAPEKIHSVINFQLLIPKDNRDEKRAKELKDWIKDWDRKVRDPYLVEHLIPTDPKYWTLDNFDGLLRLRTELLIKKIMYAVPTQIIDAEPTSSITVTGPKRKADDKVEHEEYDKAALWAKVPDEYKDHPILKDNTTIDSIFGNTTGCGQRWVTRYRNELTPAQLVTVADFALLVITFGITPVRKDEWGTLYVFKGGGPSLKPLNFGNWAWGVVLEQLKRRGLDWEKFVTR